MSERHLTPANDVYDQRSNTDPAQPWDWLNLYGEGGDDHLLIYAGNVLGGPGNDWIGSDPTVPDANVGAVYWNSPGGVLVDLGAGYALDGWGGTDTLSGVLNAQGSWRDDFLYGSEADNSFWPNGGHDRIDGRGGIDRVSLAGVPADYIIEVAGDGMHATITRASDRSLLYELTDVETLNFWQDGNGLDLTLAELVRPQTRAVYLLMQDPSARWNAAQPMGAPTTVSFSFRTQPSTGEGMPGNGFQPFDAGQRQRVRDILSELSAQTGLTFEEVPDAPAREGQIRFGISQQSDTAGVSFAPNDPGAGARAGDVWMDVETMADLSAGSIGFGVLIHEIGHALGLAHPGADGALRGDLYADDNTIFTAMSEYGLLDGLPRTGFGVYDLLALQAIYGLAAARTGDDLYRLDDTAGRSQWVLFDDGGNDTLDVSALSYGVQLQLAPSAPGTIRLSSVGVRPDGAAALDNLALMPGTWIESAIGTAFDDLIVGNALDNVITALTGNDEIDAGEGTDTVVLPGALADYRFSSAYGVLQVISHDGASGAKALTSVERLTFSDFRVNLQMDETLGGVAASDLQCIEELYVAFFNRVPNAEGLTHWIGRLQAGDATDTIAEAFYQAGMQYADLTGYRADMSHRDFVNAVYRNVLARPEGASAEGLAYWSGELASGDATHGSLVTRILASAHTFKGDPVWGWVADLLDNKLAVAEKFAVEWGLSFASPREAIARGMAIAAAVTPQDTSAAIALIGLSESDMQELADAL